MPRYCNWKTFARLVSLLAVAWLITTRLDAAKTYHAFVQLKLSYLLPVILILSPLAVLLRALRWRVLLADGKRLPLHAYVRSQLIGVLANSLLLGRFGDLVKAKVICDSQLNYGRSLAVVTIDRLLEGVALLLVFTAILLNAPLPGWAFRLGWVAGLASAAALAGMRILFHFRGRFLVVAEHALEWVPSLVRSRILNAVQRLLDGCEVLADYRRVLVAILYALAVWAVEIATVAVFFAAFSIPVPVLVAAPVLLVVLNFGILVPIMPGSIGIYQMLCVLALSLWGVDRGLSFAFGIVMQTVLFVPLYVAGLICLLAMKGNQNKKSALPVLEQ